MSYCRCSTQEQVNREFVRTMKDRMRELKLSRKKVATMARCGVSNVSHVLGSRRDASLATMLNFADKLGLTMCIAFEPKEIK